jgi:transcriptional regulator with XRE-family HTH domain
MAAKESHALSRLLSAPDVCRQVGERAARLRIDQGFRRADLAESTGVSVSTIARFERTGRVAFDVIVKIAIALRAEREFLSLFPPVEFASIDDVIASSRRPQRVRKRKLP